MIRHFLYVAFLFLLLADLSYSYVQYLDQTLDGDMSRCLVPELQVQRVLDSPLGIKTICEHIPNVGPNRFYSHWIYREYMLQVPLLLQRFFSPIDSIYQACAIGKLGIHMLLLFLLAMAISGTTRLLKWDTLVAAVLVAPFFQTEGYHDFMGMIDRSTTYTFFYALPSALLLIYLMPVIFRAFHGKTVRFGPFNWTLWMGLAVVVCLSGPLNPGIVLVLTILVFLSRFRFHSLDTAEMEWSTRIKEAWHSASKWMWAFMIPITLLSLYSLFLGQYNSETIVSQIPLWDMYLKLPEGVVRQFTRKLGFPILFLILTLNTILIRRYGPTEKGAKILSWFKWIGLFSVLYILLLPLGGYRSYRPYILRYDTIMPITLSLLFIFGVSSQFLLRQLSKRQRVWYIPVLIIVLAVFSNADRSVWGKSVCERSALLEIAASQDSVVVLDQQCSVLGWGLIRNPDESALNGKLLTLWGVTKEDKRYYNLE
ncbi:MAG: hypothetical protein K9I85_11930 [Saprospiraceae bacterium]|nr:hypothetical protein [Saprospiraceae bacterium]